MKLKTHDFRSFVAFGAVAVTVAFDPIPDRPKSPLEFNGKPWPVMHINKSHGHFFGIGDWGGDAPGGHTWTNPGRCADSTESKARPCVAADNWAQKNVANQMIKRAAESDLDYVLNVGDNFYPGGYDTKCGSQDSTNQFVERWENIYKGANLTGKPWLSVLGNHDYGGRSHNAGWDQQIFMTWSGKPWVLPAQYWSRLVQYQGFAVQYYFVDSNFLDAGGDPNHKICQGGGECFGLNDDTCPSVLQNAWNDGLKMVEDVIKESTAEWHIFVTHFPGPSIAGIPEFQRLHKKYHFDLVLSGHVHDQQKGNTFDTEWIISGGGGGVTTDGSPDEQQAGYGFIDFEISRTELHATFINWAGKHIMTQSYWPHPRRKKIAGDIVV